MKSFLPLTLITVSSMSHTEGGFLGVVRFELKRLWIREEKYFTPAYYGCMRNGKRKF